LDLYATRGANTGGKMDNGGLKHREDYTEEDNQAALDWLVREQFDDEITKFMCESSAYKRLPTTTPCTEGDIESLCFAFCEWLVVSGKVKQIRKSKTDTEKRTEEPKK
jgi:hypothetical protein